MGSPHFDARSLWQRIEKPFFLPLALNAHVDVCIVGAGITGLTTAYRLLKAGKKVVVLDRERLGLGETGLTSAHLSSALDERFANLRRVHGDLHARLAFESHARAIDDIEAIARDEKIDCDFERVDGYLFCGPDEDVTLLREELEACHALGFTDVELLNRAPLKLFDTGACLRFPRQAQFHPLRYLIGLARAVQDLGGRIHTHAEVINIEDGEPVRVTTSQGYQVVCSAVVVATDVPINNRITVHAKMAPYRSYVIAMRIPPERVDRALLWDTAEPYHYVRVLEDEEGGQALLLIGGEDHRTGQDVDPEDHFYRLETWARARLGVDPIIVARWSGQIIEPMDGLAFIGLNPGEKHVFIATGDSGHGLTHGTLAARLLTDLIEGRPNEWESVYDPSRINLRGLNNFLREQLKTSLPYGDWFSPGDVASVEDVKEGHGAIVRAGLDKVAVYRDALGHAHCFSAVCPHLGGIVRWNGAEKTWDCPCHGSRFDKFGEVLNGPAITGLHAVMDPTLRQPQSAFTPTLREEL